MNAPSVITTAAPIGRRRESRLRVRLDAQLITLDGTVRGVLADVSGWGARVSALNLPLRPGEEAVLQWCGREAFGVVVWAAAGQGGLCFYDPILKPELSELRRINDMQDRHGERTALRGAARAFVKGKIRL